MSYKILLVDDDREFREEFQDAFEEYDVLQASSGSEALDILKRPNEIDIVVLDVMMPGMRGTETLKEIKKLSPSLAIVIVTGFSSTEVAVEALKGHADDYIEKPINIDRAKEILDVLLKSKDGEVENLDLKGKIERVKRFAERNFDRKVTLEDAAKAVGLSSKYLSRIFKSETGNSFSEYRIECKVHRAKEMLFQTGLNVNQISDKLCYENVESFIRTFKKIAGSTPTEFRKDIRQKSE